MIGRRPFVVRPHLVQKMGFPFASTVLNKNGSSYRPYRLPRAARGFMRGNGATSSNFPSSAVLTPAKNSRMREGKAKSLPEALSRPPINVFKDLETEHLGQYQSPSGGFAGSKGGFKQEKWNEFTQPSQHKSCPLR
jgi:hypothetical protein